MGRCDRAWEDEFPERYLMECLSEIGKAFSTRGEVTDAIFSCFLASRVDGDASWRLKGSGIQSTVRQGVGIMVGAR